MQWNGTEGNFCPLNKMGDGTMDFLISTQASGGGKMPILRVLLDQEGAAYWNEQRQIKRDRGLEYAKATEFTLDPLVKS